MAENTTFWTRMVRSIAVAAIAVTLVPASGTSVVAAGDETDFTCEATDLGLSWTSTSANNYYVRKSVGGDSSYLGSTDQLTYATNARYGTFTVISYTGGRRVATCVGPGGPTRPPFTCSVDGSTLSWDDQGVDRYNLRREVDGVDGYLGATTALTHEVDPVGIYTVITWSRGVKSMTRCAGTTEDRPGPDLVWKTNNTKSAFRMNLLRGTTDPRGDVLSVANVQLVSGPDFFVTVEAQHLAVDPTLVTQTERVVFNYDIVGDPGIVYRSSATIKVAFVNVAPVDANENIFVDAHRVFEERTGLEATYPSVFGSFDFGFQGGLAVAQGGRVYIADTRNHQIQICDSFTGCAPFGGFGDGAGQFQFPVGLAVHKNRDVWVGDAGNGRIQRCNRSGQTCQVFEFVSPVTGDATTDSGPVTAIAFPDVDHIVFAAGTLLTSCRVDGSECAELVSVGARADDVIVQIATAPTGEAYVGTVGGLLAVCDNLADDPQCVRSAAASQDPGDGTFFEAAVGVAVDPQGRLIVSDIVNQQLRSCDALALRCDPIAGTGGGPIAAPQQVGVDSNGLIYVVDIEFQVVQVIERRGLLINATDADGDVVAVSAVNGDASAVGGPTSTEKGALVTIDSDGGFTYDPTGSAILQGLGMGESTSDVITYDVADGRGGVVTSQITLWVTGRHVN